MAMAALVYLLGRFPKQRKVVYASMILFGVILTGVAGCSGGGSKTKTVTIQANYSGDSNYNSSSGQVIITVQ